MQFALLRLIFVAIGRQRALSRQLLTAADRQKRLLSLCLYVVLLLSRLLTAKSLANMRVPHQG